MRLNSWPTRAKSSLPAVGTTVLKSPLRMRWDAWRKARIWLCSEREMIAANVTASRKKPIARR